MKPPASLAMLLLALLPGLQSSAFSAQPNLVFIMADDLGWRDLGCFGSTFHRTPNLDRLAARGVRFTQAYAANPLCSPTRSSVLTGLWPARTGITAPACHLPQVVLEKGLVKGSPKMRMLVAESVTRLKTDYVTLPEVLRAAGYRTGHFGKWHLGAEPYSPLQHGFDVDFPHWPGPGPAGSYLAPWAAAFPQKGKPGEHLEDVTSEAAAEFIRAHRDRPFFVNYWPFSVHAPYDAKPELVEKYRQLAEAKNPPHNPLYAAMVQSLDEGVGRVLAALQECGLVEKTIVVFFSDNGGVNWDALKGKEARGGAKGLATEFADIPPTSNAPLRAGKASIYEGGVREPCIVVWPGVTPPGTTKDTVIQSIDWMPTLLEMAGVAVPAGVRPDGVSLVPLLKGGGIERDRIFCHFPHDTPASGQHPATTVRRGDWKLHRIFAGNADGSDQLELYHLRDDLGETQNLAAAQPALVRELDALISGFLKETDAVIPKLNPGYRAADAGGKKSADPLQGWVARSCAAVVKDGSLVVTGRGPAPFLGIGAGTKGPGAVLVRARSSAGGAGKIEWIPPGKTQAEARSAPFALESGDWQELRVTLPADATLGILRLYLPAQQQPVELDWIELKTATKPRRWDF